MKFWREATLPSFTEELSSRVLVSDGAMGTMLHAAGHAFDGALANLSRSNPTVVAAIHEAYVTAGADVIQTNTFGASRLRLARYGLANDAREINLAASDLAGKVRARRSGPLFVAGSVSPACRSDQPESTSAGERQDVLFEQIDALVEGGVDLLVLETFGSLEELVEAVQVASIASDLPLVAQATFGADGRTLSGHTPTEVATTLCGLPVTAIGANCLLGPRGLLPVIQELGAASAVALSAQPNGGRPRRIGGSLSFSRHVDTAYYADHARAYVEAGAGLVGGCCGTTPAIIRAIAARVKGSSPRARHMHAPADGFIPTEPEGRMPERPQRLEAQLVAGRFVVAAELMLAEPGMPADEVDLVRAMRNRGVDVVAIPVVTDVGGPTNPMIAAARIVQHTRAEPLLAVTAADRSVLALQAGILGVHALGVRNIVCHAGNLPLVGDYPLVSTVWEPDVRALVELLSGLNAHRDGHEGRLEMPTSLFIGVACNLGADDLGAELTQVVASVAAGARFVMTCATYDPDAILQLAHALEQSGGDQSVPILLTLRLLRSYDEAAYLANEVPDARIPEAVLDALRAAGPDAKCAGVDMALQLLADVRPYLAGVVVADPSPDAVLLDRVLKQRVAGWLPSPGPGRAAAH
jgi:homocysteine S-methyltransferase